MAPTIRPERPGDQAAIRALIGAAFEGRPFSDGDEGPLVDRLREDGDLRLSLVATSADGAIIGHIAFSPCRIEPAGTPPDPGAWVQLAPVSVIPQHQKRGIGSLLIGTGLDHLAYRGTDGVALVGDPAYYRRFGFTREHGLSLDPAVGPYLQVRRLSDGPNPSGALSLAPAFG